MKRLMLIVAATALPTAALNAAVTSATPFADNMVLQMGRPVPVWGKADPGETVTVTFAGQTKTAKAGADGAWRVTLDAMEASRENRTMTIGDTQIRNVLVGEVWFASGQSNMECPIWGGAPRYRDAKGGIMTQMARRPFVRYVRNDHNLSCTPRLDWKAQWRDFSPQSFREKTLSAVAFYYALEIYSALEIPVGIIDSSWGGTRIEPWTPLAPGEKEAPPPADGKIPRGRPHSMFNGMVAGFAPFASRGMIWYQGCSNAGDGDRYAAKMHKLYDGWSREFENPGFRLYFVQLAPFRHDYFRIRLAQSRFAEEEKNAAIAVICDAGNLADIHPNEKEIVAKRLAIHALKRDYGFTDIIDDSPVLKDWRIEDGKFVLSFKDATTWYVYRDDYKMEIPGFEIAGADGKFVPAKVLNKIADGRGTLKGSELVVAAEGVSSPKQLRYLASSPWTGALYSFDSGLPLGTFEIDARSVATERKPGVSASAGDALLDGFRKVVVADIPVGKPLKEDGYSFDGTSDAGQFSRVAYKFELEHKDGSVDWVVAAMDAFTADAAKAGVPSMSGASFQRKVSGLSVRSNVVGVEDSDGVEGAIEFFTGNYHPKKGMAGVPGDDSIYDINDTAAKPAGSGYGSMQLHDLASGKTVFAFNCFNGPNADVGIGNNTCGQHPDWTFSKNASLYKSRRLSVFVK
ncbi:MAG: hypothetical protein J6T51_04470 [Kiritimatiellae bacterium]|nr:hypothetical protein [Kiritimatiellia bacterium]